jgi:glycosyltransferase involved in cell wall biosynthesis
MVEQPLVTVAIPTWNREASLRSALKSVLEQDYPRIQVLVGDNASTDGTMSIRDDLAGDPRVEWIRHATNIGPIANFERLLSAARGDYFMWLADDDRVSRGYVRRCVETLSAPNPPARVAGRAVYVRDGEVVRVERADLSQTNRCVRLLQYYREVQGNFLFYSMSTTALARVGLPLRGVPGFDWIHVARHVFLGGAITLEDVTLEMRAYARTDAAKSDHSMGAGWHRHAYKMLLIPRDVVADMLTHDVYEPLPPLKRWLLALRCGVIAFRRLSGRAYWVGAIALTLRESLPTSLYVRLRFIWRRLGR